MVIHAHHSQSPVSGEMKRIINIDTDVAGILSDKIVEIEFYSLKAYKYVHKEGLFKLSDKVIKKYYVPNIEHLGFLNNLYCSFVIAFICKKFRPTHYIEEWKFPKGLKSLRNYFFKKTQLVLDLHGAAPEEYLYLHGTSSCVLENSEAYSVSIADKIICQSDKMKCHLVEKYGYKLDDICVFRCGVDINVFGINDSARLAIRKSLNIADNDIVFVYAGGMHKWQNVGKALKYYLDFNSKYANSKMLVLTNDIEGLNQIIDEERLDGICSSLLVKSLPYSEVASYLNAADVSFLIRDNVVMNAVASPTKLAEYMACGLPVISTFVAQNWVSEEGMSYVFDYENTSIYDLKNLLSSIDRERIGEYSATTLSLTIDRQTAKEFFGK